MNDATTSATAAGDRLSQLQREFHRLAELQYTAVGVIQDQAPPLLDGANWMALPSAAVGAPPVPAPATVTAAELEANRVRWIEFNATTRKFAKDIVATHGVIAQLLDSLPRRAERSADAQRRLLVELEQENERTTAELKSVLAQSGKRQFFFVSFRKLQ